MSHGLRYSEAWFNERQKVGKVKIIQFPHGVPSQVPKASKRASTQALGRLPAGQMNKTEAAYAQALEFRRAIGEVVWWKFEGIKLRLAEKTFLTVDFFVMLATGELEAHEVKGFMEEDANVKLKTAASMYPFRFVKVKKDGNSWITSVVGVR